MSDGDVGSNRSGMDPWQGLGVIDTYHYLHPLRRGYTYYPRMRKFGESCDRVDMILISKSLTSMLKTAGMHATPQE